MLQQANIKEKETELLSKKLEAEKKEIALTILLAGFTLVFIIVCVTLKPFADYANTPITIAAFVSLFVCLMR